MECRADSPGCVTRNAEQAVMLLSAHIMSSQSEVRKITLHEMHMARLNGQADSR